MHKGFYPLALKYLTYYPPGCTHLCFLVAKKYPVLWNPGSKDSASHVFNFFQISHQYSTKLCKFFESGKLCHLWKFVFGDMIFRLKNHWILSAFFNCYLAAPQPTLGHYQGGSLTHPMLITCILHIWPEGQRESHSEVGSLSPSEHLVGFEPGTLRFWIFDNSFQIYPTWKLIMGESYKTLL